MSQLDLRQDKSYRRGLVLGLTIAEIMILLMFVLLMALGAALHQRDEKIAALKPSRLSELSEALQGLNVDVSAEDEFFKELIRASEVIKELEQAGVQTDPDRMVEDAQLGERIRAAAQERGRRNPAAFVERLISAGDSTDSGWPPFFSLSEAGGYFFDSGKATLRPDFERSLKTQVIPMLAQYIEEYDVDVVEVIGHTDEVPMSGVSNLDSKLIAASMSRAQIAELRSTDNAGLAMARAVAVVHVLRADPRLSNVTVLPLSGAQMIVPVDRMADGSSAGDDQKRRRIEIRLRKSTTEAPTAAAR